MSRWVKVVMLEAGVDTSMFKPGSTRSAAASKADKAGFPLDEILQASGWSRESTFTKWYKKEVKKRRIGNQMAETIISSGNKK